MRILFSLLLVLFCSQLSFGQSQIGSLVLEKVNHLRDSLNLPHLSLDPILSEAGEDQAYYMSKKNTLGHFQSTFSKETPSERVLFYKGNRTYVGENVASVTAKWLNKKLDEEYLAEKLFKSWYNSPGHYKNMIHLDYTRMGLGQWVSSDKNLYAAQVFSSNEIRLPQAFENSDLSWGVRPAKFTCKDEPETYETMFFANSIEIEGNSVYFYFHDLKFFRNVIQSDNDGLAIDVVLREQLPCGKENQFHISEVYDGEMQRPIYKNDIYRNDVSDNPKKIRVKIGEVPSYLSSQQWEANVIIINDNKLCDYSYPVEVPSAIFPLLNLRPYFNTNDEIKVEEKNHLVVIKDSIHVELMYARSSNEFYSDDQEEFGRFLGWRQYAKQVDVNCFASVEGAKWMNYKLLEERESRAIELLSSRGFNLNEVNISTRENWDLMNQQIEDFSLNKLKGKTPSEIRYHLKKHSSDLTDSLLFEQRKTHIRAWVDTTIELNSYDNFHFAYSYDSTLSIYDLPWNKILREEYIKAEQNIDQGLIDSLIDKKHLKTNLLGAAAIDNVNSNLDSVLVQLLGENVDINDSKQVFNYAHFLTKYWFSKYSRSYKLKGVAETITPNELKEMISNIDSTIISNSDLVRLQINVLLSGIHYYVAHNNWDPVQKYFDDISDLVQKDDFTREEVRELALFCNHFHKFEEAVEILHPFHEESNLTEDGYFVLAITSTLIRSKLEAEDYRSYMASAKRVNHKRYCDWLNDSFQIQRDEFIKTDFCRECK